MTINTIMGLIFIVGAILIFGVIVQTAYQIHSVNKSLREADEQEKNNWSSNRVEWNGRGGRMRDYKFRGQKIYTKEWIYGSFIQIDSNGHQCFIFPENTPFCIELTDFYTIPILKETVGQYTGLHDRNGKEIYEGDLVIIPVEDEQEAVKIEWDNDSSRFVFSARTYTCDFDSYGGEDCEVVGNIYDNFEQDESVK